MSNTARIDDAITGSCTGTYQKYEIVGYTPIEYDIDNNPIGGGDAIYGWVDYSETGTTSGKVIIGSDNVFINNKGVARVGDTVSIHKNYENTNHLDPLDINGTISSGVSNVIVNGKSIAFKGSNVTAEGCSVTLNEGSSNVFC